MSLSPYLSLSLFLFRFRHWVTFVSSSRRMAPPGPIDNLWMIQPKTDTPFLFMVEDTDDKRGDFRRVPPQVLQ